MDGLTMAEHALSGACCVGPDPYHPIGKFQAVASAGFRSERT